MTKLAIRIVFTIFTIYLTVIALTKVFGIELAGLNYAFPQFTIPYQIAIEWPFNVAKNWLLSFSVHIPEIAREVLVLWFAMGRIVRRSISDISAESDAMTERYNPNPKVEVKEKIRKFLRNPVKVVTSFLKTPLFRESVIATVFWPWRLVHDIKGTYLTHREYVDGKDEPIAVRKYSWFIFWGLSPKKVAIYIGISTITLIFLQAIDIYITSQ